MVKKMWTQEKVQHKLWTQEKMCNIHKLNKFVVSLSSNLMRDYEGDSREEKMLK